MLKRKKKSRILNKKIHKTYVKNVIQMSFPLVKSYRRRVPSTNPQHLAVILF